MLKCSTCKLDAPSHLRVCPGCQSDLGFPNVRAAQAPEERDALYKRLLNGETSTDARGCRAILEDFGVAVNASKAIVCRGISIILKLVSSDNELYTNFYKQVGSESRIPEDNRFDRGRPAVDGTLFPLYHQEICFAALSLNNIGSTDYGPYSIVLKEDVIRHRATVFEENAFYFCQIKHRIVAGSPIPPGYRAVWAERGILAKAKLHSKITPATRPEDFPGILLSGGPKPGDEDFIEVHVYGPIHRNGIELVAGPKPSNRPDRILCKSLERKLSEVGASLVLT